MDRLEVQRWCSWHTVQCYFGLTYGDTKRVWGFFLDPDVNKMLKKILNAWAEYLASPSSAYVLGNGSIGWFSSHGTKDLAATANVDETSNTFEEFFKCVPSKENHGYSSWAHFFTRHFQGEQAAYCEPKRRSCHCECM